MAYEDIDESKPQYDVSKLGSENPDTAVLYGKHLNQWQTAARFWKPSLEIGKKCMRFMHRNIFDESIRKEYAAMDKYPIEPQIMKPVIDALAGQVGDMVKAYTVTAEDATSEDGSQAKPEDFNAVLKWASNNVKLSRKQKRVLRDGLVTGYPQWVMFDIVSAADGLTPDLKASVLPWDSVLVNPDFADDDGSDITEMFIMHRFDRKTLCELFPDRKDAFSEWQDFCRDKPETMMMALEGLTSDDRNRIFFEMTVAAALGDTNGAFTVIEHLFTINKKTRVWINPASGDVQEKPSTWSDIRWSKWRSQNPGYSESVVMDFPVLWRTVFGQNGFVWDNKPHWFQEQSFENPHCCMLPAACFIPDLVDGIPMGKGEDMLPLIVQKAVCETEGLSEVRKGMRRTTFIEEGTIRHPSTLASELAKEDGVVLVKKGSNLATAMNVVDRKVNTTFYDMSERVSEQIREAHSVNPAMMGDSAPRQSAVAKNMEIKGGLMSQSSYVENYNSFSMWCAQLICFMVPYFLTDERLIEIDDDIGGKKKSVQVNQQSFDAQGNAVTVANDLKSARFRIVPVPGDDSATSRERDMMQFMQLLEAFGNSLSNLDPAFTANLFSSLPNRFARECGQFMKDHADSAGQSQQQEAQTKDALDQQKLADRKQIEFAKILTPKVMLKMGPKELQEAPEGFQYFAAYLDALQVRAQGMAGAANGAGGAGPTPQGGSPEITPEMQQQLQGTAQQAPPQGGAPAQNMLSPLTDGA